LGNKKFGRAGENFGPGSDGAGENFGTGSDGASEVELNVRFCKTLSCFRSVAELLRVSVAMAGAGKLLGMDKLRAQNLLVAGGLTSFVGAVYFYTMKAVGSGDDLQEAVQILEQEKQEKTAAAASASAVS